MPFITCLIYDLTSYHDSNHWSDRYKNPYFWFYTLGCYYVNSRVFYFSSRFIEIARIDLARKNFMMKALTIMLDSNRFRIYGTLKLFPLLNFFDK